MDKPIGVFDSGLGGLTVVRECLRHMPQADIIYLGDTARVPYGTKSAQTVIRFAEEDMRFLLSFDVQAIVVACNTASSVAIDTLQAQSPVPVIGVIAPGARVAALATRNKKIGVIGTPSTIASGAYEQALHACDEAYEIRTASCPLFVPLAEEGWLDDVITEAIAERYLAPLRSAGVDTLILGCTHYPLLETVIGRIMGPGVRLVNSAQAVATMMNDYYTPCDQDSMSDETFTTSRCRFFVSDEPLRFQQIAERFLGATIDTLEQVSVEILTGCHKGN